MQNHENRVPPATERRIWNKGKLIGAKPPLRPKHVWSIRTKLQVEGKNTRLGDVQLGDRQQAARLRRGQREGRGRRSAWTSRRPRDCAPEEDRATRPVR